MLVNSKCRASCTLLEWDRLHVLVLQCAGSVICRLLSEFRSCPFYTDRPQGLVRSFTNLGFLLAFDRKAMIHNSVEAENVLISHGFPYGGLILAVFFRVGQNFHSAVHQSSGQHASVGP